MNRKLIFTLSLIVIGLSGLFLYSGSLVHDSVVIADVDTVAANLDRYQDRELRIRGFVKPGSIIRTSNKASFIIEHNGKELPVFFNGQTQLPDTFSDSAAVRADGHIENGQLVSSRIEAKCASKYDAEYKEAHPEGISLEYKSVTNPN